MIKKMCNRVSSSTNQRKKIKIIRKWNSIILKSKTLNADISLININEGVKNNRIKKKVMQ